MKKRNQIQFFWSKFRRLQELPFFWLNEFEQTEKLAVVVSALDDFSENLGLQSQHFHVFHPHPQQKNLLLSHICRGVHLRISCPTV